MLLACFVAILDCLDTPYMSQNRLEGPRMHRNVPQEQRLRQKDQHVIGVGDDTRIDPKVVYKGTKLCQNAKKNMPYSARSC